MADEVRPTSIEETVTVPDAVGLFAASAQSFLVGMGFSVGFETIPSSDAGALVVLAQEPAAATEVTLPASVLLQIGSGVPQRSGPPIEPPAQTLSS